MIELLSLIHLWLALVYCLCRVHCRTFFLPAPRCRYCQIPSIGTTKSAMSNINKEEAEDNRVQENGQPALETALERKSFFEAALPVFACGAGLFSDGYINNVSRISASLLGPPEPFQYKLSDKSASCRLLDLSTLFSSFNTRRFIPPPLLPSMSPILPLLALSLASSSSALPQTTGPEPTHSWCPP